jgi:cation transport ATPase
VKGMTCAACSSSIETSLNSQLQLKSVKVDLFNQTVTIESESDLRIDRVVEIIKGAGFIVVASSSDWRCRLDAHRRTEAQEFKFIRERFIKILFFALPVIISSHFNHHLALIFSIPLHLFAAKDLYIAAFRRNSMERLIMLSCASSLIYSLIYFGRQHEMFDCAGLVLVLFTGGKLVEAVLKRRIIGNCDGLLHLDCEDRFKDMKIGQVYNLKAGDLVPIDGEIVDGSLFVDESKLTGEPMPKNKRPSDHVLAGTKVKHGEGKIQVIRSFENSFINKLARAVFEPIINQKTNGGNDQIAEKVSRIFIPTILLFSLMTFMFWYLFLWMSSSKLGDLIPEWRDSRRHPSSAFSGAFYFGLTVLSIACPCALSVATPVAEAVAKGVAFKRGFVLRDLEKFEAAHRKINVLLFDKTGTLTTGKPTIFYKKICEIPWILDACGAIERHLLEREEHPIARAIYNYCTRFMRNGINCEKQNVLVLSIKAIQGCGVIGRVQVENEEMCHVVRICKNDAKCGNNDDDDDDGILESGSSVFVDDELIGEFGWFDELKEEAVECVNYFRKLNFRLGLISGDSQMATERIAAKFLPGTFTFVFGCCSPMDKARIVDDLREQGNGVAFCGDGVNDSIAMTRSDFSISLDPTALSYPSVSLCNITSANDNNALFSNPSQRDSSKVSLLLLPKIFHLSRQLSRQIRFNLFWAALYNALALPLAMGMGIAIGIPPIGPEVATGLMVLSGTSIIITTILFLSFI